MAKEMKTITQTLPDKITRPREWNFDNKGRPRLNGRWSKERIAEHLINVGIWQSVDELARIVYGATSETRRMNVRKHIPTQRKYMLHELQQPIVTRYGSRGIIMAIKYYNQTAEFDRMLLRTELERARDRKELSEKRYEQLLNVFLLTDGTQKE
jgi:hypothetical protein